MEHIKVSVLIPTYNAEIYIEELISKLKSQVFSGGNLEIIIVDSSSSDRTVGIVREKYPELKIIVIDNNKFDHGGTRNLLASLAAGDYLLFMTQDAIPYDNNLIENLLTPFQDNKVKIVYARQLPKSNANVLETFARNFNYPDIKLIKEKASIKTLGIKTFFNSNVCSMYAKELFGKGKGFPEKIILNEDMVLASKVILDNKKVVYQADAKVYHSHNYGIKQQFKRYFDIGMAFNQTKYLNELASNEKEGTKMVLNQINYLLKIKRAYLIPYAIFENIAKFIGYYLGKRNKYIPKHIKKRLSAYMK